MSRCRNYVDLDRMARWMADLDRIVEEMTAADQAVNAEHLETIANDLEFQTREFTENNEPQVTRRGVRLSHDDLLDDLLRRAEGGA
jgi:hypothetical protein